MHPVCRRLLPFAYACALAWAPALLAGSYPPTPVLLVDFEAQPLGEPIGTGGPEQGQPIDTGIVNEVVAGEIDGQSLRVADSGVSRAVSMRFEFLDSLELREGVLTISVQVKPEVGDSFFIRLREQGLAAKNFGQVMIAADGAVRVSDAAGDAGEVAVAGSIAAGTVHTIDWVHALEAGTYSVFLDGVELIADRAHGIDTSTETGRGIGALLFGYSSDAGTTGVMHLDNIEVTTDTIAPPVIEPIFDDGFEPSPTS